MFTPRSISVGLISPLSRVSPYFPPFHVESNQRRLISPFHVGPFIIIKDTSPCTLESDCAHRSMEFPMFCSHTRVVGFVMGVTRCDSVGNFITHHIANGRFYVTVFCSVLFFSWSKINSIAYCWKVLTLIWKWCEKPLIIRTWYYLGLFAKFLNIPFPIRLPNSPFPLLGNLANWPNSYHQHNISTKPVQIASAIYDF